MNLRKILESVIDDKIAQLDISLNNKTSFNVPADREKIRALKLFKRRIMMEKDLELKVLQVSLKEDGAIIVGFGNAFIDLVGTDKAQKELLEPIQEHLATSITALINEALIENKSKEN